MLDAFAAPTSFSAADNAGCAATLPTLSSGQVSSCERYAVTAMNAGSQPTDGSTVTLADTLPAGLTVQKVSFYWSGLPQSFGGPFRDLGGFLCTTAPLQCRLPTGAFRLPPVAPNDRLEMIVYVTVDAGVSGTLTNAATVSGGGAPTVSTTDQNGISSAPPPFGVSGFSSYIAGVDGAPYTQAGGHPWGLTTRIDLASVDRIPPDQNGSSVEPTSVEDVRDVVVDLPVGFLGNATAAPTCPPWEVASSSCPADTVVGHILTEPLSATSANSPIWNMAPEQGVAAEFGYNTVGGSHVLRARVVPTAAGYVLQVTSPQVPQVALTDILVTFYGDPAIVDGAANTPVVASAMFTNPTGCDGQPLTTTAYMDSWQDPGTFNADGTPDLSDPAWVSATSTSPPVEGCDQLQFKPAMTVQPDTTVADSPSGLNVDIKVPQTEDPSTLATPPLRDGSVTLPPGFTVNPSSAAGLQACTPAQITLGSAAPPTCPDASKIGTVALQTPLLPGTLTGSIYLASEFDNPFHSLLAGYIVVDDPTTGVVIKIPGNLTLNPQTGQITGVFDNNPQFPFSDLKLDFKGGPTGVLATPESCGSFTTRSVFSPWSAPDSGPASTPSDSFSIDSGCVSGFAPSFTAGTQNAQAGTYSPFVLSLSRQDTDENFSGLSVTLPPGMLAKLAGVQECSEQQLASISSAAGTGANELANPSCPAGSQVGTVTTGAGTGPDPFFLGGKAYLTGPYKGAPYGLAVVVPAVAGPLDLGTVVVRQALYVDPTTAQVTDVSDPFPTILDGIPLRIRRIDVNLNRPDFTVNPTSCDPMSIGALLSSTGGLMAGESVRFQVGAANRWASPRS